MACTPASGLPAWTRSLPLPTSFCFVRPARTGVPALTDPPSTCSEWCVTPAVVNPTVTVNGLDLHNMELGRGQPCPRPVVEAAGALILENRRPATAYTPPSVVRRMVPPYPTAVPVLASVKATPLRTWVVPLD